MNYYPRHIGDYLKDTAHLSLLEHGIYSRLLDVYYSTEAPIAADQAARLIGARSKEERAALAAVLAEFFKLDGGVYRHNRCDRELTAMQLKQSKARESAAKRWESKASNANASANAMPTHSEGNAPNTNTNIAPKVHVGRGTRLPEGWEPMAEGREFALSVGIAGAEFQVEAARFCDYWRAQPGQKGVKTDWPATWRNWCRKAVESKPKPMNGVTVPLDPSALYVAPPPLTEEQKAANRLRARELKAQVHGVAQ